MNLKLLTFSTVALAISALLGSTTAMGQICSAELGPRSPVAEVLACMRALETSIQALEEEVSVARRMAQVIAIIPSGAVLAFDRASGCPNGWNPFDDAAGRVIVGVGQGSGTTERPYRAREGVEKLTLTERELPTLEIEVGPIRTVKAEVLPAGSGANFYNPSAEPSVRWSGAGSSLSNMPPFIALYFCKKE